MIQEINYHGLSTVPSDYLSPDGTLATSINLVPENGQLNPVFQPKEIASLPSGYNIAFIHKTAEYTNYIVQRSLLDGIYMYALTQLTDTIEESDIVKNELYFANRPHEIVGINAIGNTIIITTEYGLNYFLHDSQTLMPTYKWLGDHIPELPISFGLVGDASVSDETTIDLSNYPWLLQDLIPSQPGESTTIATEGMTSYMSNIILGKANRFIADESIKKGKFLFPFFVRYALRLFDDSVVMQSSPVLMVTDSDVCPHAVCTGWHTEQEDDGRQIVTDLRFKIFSLLFDLEYRTDTMYTDKLKEWNDIVKYVDVFVSAPMYKYDQSGKIKGLSYQNADKRGYTISKLNNDNIHSNVPVSDYYFRRPVAPQFTGYRSPLLPSFGQIEIIIPEHTYDEFNTSVSSCSNFYLLKSIELDNISTKSTIEIPEGYLGSLTARETLKDDYDSHDSLLPRFTQTYNSRLHLGNIQKRINDTNPADAYCAKTDNAFEYNVSQNKYTTELGKSSYRIFVYIKQNGREIIVSHNNPDSVKLGHESTFPFQYIYYPNPNAYKIVVCVDAYSYTLPLKTHDFLNGSYYFSGFNVYPIPDPQTQRPVPTDYDKRIIALPNKLYTSEVGNPFYFPLSGINTIGTGEIIGLASANKALSQGQFGQFPLYAFCSDGVWALAVTSTGGYSAIQPITRDVCTNNKSITSTDSEVLFATDRGIMVLSGSQSACVSDAIAAEKPFDIAALPHILDLHSMMEHPDITCIPTRPFLEFIKDCSIAYDYIHQRVVYINCNYSYAYIYSLKSQQWGMMFSELAYPVNSYPEALVMTRCNKLVSISDTDELTASCFLITRPLKLGGADVLKTVHSVFQRGLFSNGDAVMVLYGSRDMEHWFVIGSSRDHRIRNIRGTGYKYFCIASVAHLSNEKSLSGASVDFEARQTNNLR